MAWKKLAFEAGVFGDDTELVVGPHWLAANGIRFRDGLPETIGGYETFLPAGQIQGLTRGLYAWRDNASASYLAIGTHKGLWVWTGGTLYDITPVDASPTLTNPFATTAGSAIVTVTSASHGRSAGDRVIFASSTVGGLTIAGEYTVQAPVATNTFTITAAAQATSTVAAGGGSVAATYLLASGNADGLTGQGFGTGGYSIGGYGTSSSVTIFARTWSLSAFGQNLVACPRGGALYQWSPATPSTRAAAVGSGSPTVNGGVIVTSQRFALAWATNPYGGSFDGTWVRWSDQENLSQWQPQATNASGDLPLSGGGTVLRCLEVRGEILAFTDTGLNRIRYIGGSLVFGQERVADGCGIVGPNAASSLGGVTYWWSRSGDIYAYDGNTARPLDCPNRVSVIQQLARVQGDKVWAFANAQFGEVWFLYPDQRDGNETSRALVFNTHDRSWTTHVFDRTAWIDAGVFPYPIAVASGTTVYYQEKGNSADGGPLSSYIESGAVDVADGDRLVRVMGCIPDFANLQGALTLTVKGHVYPADGGTVAAPQAITATTSRVDLRLTARQVRVRLDSTGLPLYWRLGAMRFDVQPTGQRR